MSETTKQVSGQRAGASAVKQAVITSKNDSSRQVNVAGGFIEFRYYESILQDGMKGFLCVCRYWKLHRQKDSL